MRHSKMPVLRLMTFYLPLFLIMGCESKETQENQTETEPANAARETASEEYSDLTEKALGHLAELDFDAWGEMLADDVTYYFPDGDSGTRTVLEGKDEVINWFQNWKESSGIETMTISQSDHFPVIAGNSLNYSKLDGVLVISYFSNEMIFEGKSVKLRMNYVSFFNEDNLIYRYYSYYDRTPIIEAMDENILADESE